jgi:hypothetical protein
MEESDADGSSCALARSTPDPRWRRRKRAQRRGRRRQNGRPVGSGGGGAWERTGGARGAAADSGELTPAEVGGRGLMGEPIEKDRKQNQPRLHKTAQGGAGNVRWIGSGAEYSSVPRVLYNIPIYIYIYSVML